MKTNTESATLETSGQSSNTYSEPVKKNLIELIERLVIEGNLQEIKNLISAGFDVNISDEDGSTPLMSAAIYGKKEIVQLLLENGADPDIRDHNGKTALILAVEKNSAHSVRLLLEAGASQKIISTSTHSALMRAAEGGNTVILDLLLSKAGSDPDIIDMKTHWGSSALMFAVQGNHKDSVKMLLEAGADPNIINKIGVTALMIAAPGIKNNDGDSALVSIIHEEKIEIVQLLLAAGADPMPYTFDSNADISNSECLKLIKATQITFKSKLKQILSKEEESFLKNGDYDNQLLQSFIEGRAKQILLKFPNNRDLTSDEFNYLYHAFFHRVSDHITIRWFQYYISGRVPIDGVDKEGKTLLMHLVQTGWKEGVDYLLKKEASVNIRDTKGKTALFHCVEKTLENNKPDKFDKVFDGYPIIKMLVEAGADVNQGCGNSGMTPLMLAVEYGDIQMVDNLLEAGAKIEWEYSSALIHAAGEGKLGMVKHLLEKGANPNFLNKIGIGAMKFAIHEGKIDVVKFLLEHGVNLKLVDALGETTLMLFTEFNILDLFLSKAKIDPDIINMKNHLGETALMFAVQNSNEVSVKTLLEAGADPNIINKIGVTALMIAVPGIKNNNGKIVPADLRYEKKIEIVKLLLAAGADPMPYTFDSNADISNSECLKLIKATQITFKLKLKQILPKEEESFLKNGDYDNQLLQSFIEGRVKQLNWKAQNNQQLTDDESKFLQNTLEYSDPAIESGAKESASSFNVPQSSSSEAPIIESVISTEHPSSSVEEHFARADVQQGPINEILRPNIYRAEIDDTSEAGQKAIQSLCSKPEKLSQLEFPVSDGLSAILENMFGAKSLDNLIGTEESYGLEAGNRGFFKSFGNWINYLSDQLSALLNMEIDGSVVEATILQLQGLLTMAGSGNLPIGFPHRYNPDDDFGDFGDFGGSNSGVALMGNNPMLSQNIQVITILPNNTLVIAAMPADTQD